MEQTRNFLPVVSTVCSNCKHCRIVPIDGCFCILECKCVGTKNPVDGNVTYKECKEARTLINGDWNIDCTWYEQRLSALQKIKRFFKHLTKFIDSLPEEPNMKNEDSSDECPCCGWALDSDGCCGSCGYGRR